MKTFILMWNPAISSYTMERFKSDQNYLCDNGYGEGVGNWSVWEYDKVEDGDRFFMVKVGEGKTGIVMSGYFFGEAYEDEDWSGKGRQTFYVDLYIQEQIDPDKAEILTTEFLQEQIPDFDWSGGHSGRLLDEKSAYKLEYLWFKYMQKIYQNTDKGAVYMYEGLYINRNMKEYLRKEIGETCEICGYNYKKIFGDKCKEYVECDYYFTPKDQEAISDGKPLDLDSKIHCICDNCKRVYENKLSN